MHSQLPTALLSVALFALVLGACGGNDGAKQPRPTDTPEATVVLEGAGTDLIDLMNQGLAVTYQASYRTSSLEGEEGDSYVIFYQPPRARVDTNGADPAEESSILIGGDRETETISCSGRPGQWRCVEIEPLGDSLLKAAGPIIFLAPLDVAVYDVSEEEQRQIGGETARCFLLTPKTDERGERAEYCLRVDGVPLYTNSISGIVEATAVSTAVSDSDFTPPAQPQPR